MRTQTMTVRVPIYEMGVIRQRAAEIGLTKSAFAGNLVKRGLEIESFEKLETLIGKLDAVLGELALERERTSAKTSGPGSRPLDPRLHAFMIEVLLLLRFLAKDDLRVKGEIGRKIQKAVGDARVEGT